MTMGPLGDDDRFRNLVGQNYGELEGKVGHEAYAANVKLQEAAALTQQRHAELLESQREHGIAQGAVDIEMSQAAIRFRDQQRELVQRFSAMVYFITWLVILGGSAGVVFLWRWALGMA
jgi:hypothetical protein